MPTLFRLLFVTALIVGAAYAGMFALANCVKPEPREIVQAVSLPQDAIVKTGRSAATRLDHEAAILDRQSHRRKGPAD